MKEYVDLRAFVPERDFDRPGLCAGDCVNFQLDSSGSSGSCGSGPTNSISTLDCGLLVVSTR
jgi:hypothetical protein